jgi:O-glycosyl hydrolase
MLSPTRQFIRLTRFQDLWYSYMNTKREPMTTIKNRSANYLSALAVLLSLILTGAAHAATTCTINQTATRQTIRGFGGSSAWHDNLTDSECDTLFGTLGLSILRVQIDANGF